MTSTSAASTLLELVSDGSGSMDAFTSDPTQVKVVFVGWLGTGTVVELQTFPEAKTPWLPDEHASTYGSLVQRLIEASGLSKTDLADMLNVSTKSLNNWIAGDIPGPENRDRLEAVTAIVNDLSGFTVQETAFRLLTRINGTSVFDDLKAGRFDSARGKASRYRALRAEPLFGRRLSKRVYRRPSGDVHPVDLLGPPEE